MLRYLLVLTMLAAAPDAGATSLLDSVTKQLGTLPSLGSGGGTSGLEASTIADGLREALTVGTDRVVSRLGSDGGFLNDKKFHIPLPGILAKGQMALRMAGLSGLADDLELRMNKAAEEAVPVAKDLFTKAITALTFEDVMTIYKGPDNAATQYLERTTGDSLKAQMRPIVDNALEDAGAVQAFDQLAGEAASIPMLGDVKTSLSDHVLGYANNAIFSYLATEEKAIRENPAKRSTELLKTVFGG